MKLFLFLFVCSLSVASARTLTNELNGVELTYEYENGMAFNIKYTPEGVRYRYLSGEAPNEWWGPFPYKAFKTPHGEYFLGWYEKGFGDQITQLVNLSDKTLYGSGIIVKNNKANEHFERAKIKTVLGWKSGH